MLLPDKIKRAVVAIACIALLPLHAAGWGMNGHRIVGQIADTHLKSKARKEIRKILGEENLAMAANWGDFIKSDSSYNYLDSWHYVNIPAGLDQQGVFDFLDADKSANVYNKIGEMVMLLKDKTKSTDEKKMALRLLIHMVGDLHQPMHTARKEDLGGNRMNLLWFGQRSNLHRVWDQGLVDYQQLSYTEYAAVINHPSKAQLDYSRNTSLKHIVYDSYLACNSIYAATKADDKLSYDYNFKFVGLLNTQMLKGGLSLAQLLNNIYG